MLALMILDLFHQIGLYFKLLCLQLRFKNDHVFILAGHLLLDITAEPTHLGFNLFNYCASVYHL